ncbi:MAG: alpha/beta fold hydrolase [Anderseniella sp.]|nr:alpha/beta fold hydrolase [Anderseniella sp.]
MIFDNEALDWEREGKTWPHHQVSRFVMADRVRFHVQVAGEGPVCLLLHGTGASTHSWRKVMPQLRERFTVVMPDLPGHGFTSMPALEHVSLGGYARLIGSLLRELGMAPELVAGHSAGAAIATEMALREEISPSGIISFNGAFVPMGGSGNQFFSPLAKMLSLNPLMPKLFAWRAASRKVVEGLITGTGSHLDEEGLDLYQRLMMSPAHCSAALQMMARWDLNDMVERMVSGLRCPILLVAAEGDLAISPADAKDIAARLPSAQLKIMQGAGHLAHEEQPDEAAAIILDAWQDWSMADGGNAYMAENMAC